MVDLELVIALALALLHFGLPVAYYLYLRALVELYITSSLAITLALIKSIIGIRSVVWEKIESMREI